MRVNDPAGESQVHNDRVRPSETLQSQNETLHNQEAKVLHDPTPAYVHQMQEASGHSDQPSDQSRPQDIAIPMLQGHDANGNARLP